MLKEYRAKRTRAKIHGTAERPRLSVHFSNQHITAQIIDDDKKATLCYSCPCVTCAAICDRPERVATCDAYQLWLWERMKHR